MLRRSEYIWGRAEIQVETHGGDLLPPTPPFFCLCYLNLIAELFKKESKLKL